MHIAAWLKEHVNHLAYSAAGISSVWAHLHPKTGREKYDLWGPCWQGKQLKPTALSQGCPNPVLSWPPMLTPRLHTFTLTPFPAWNAVPPFLCVSRKLDNRSTSNLRTSISVGLRCVLESYQILTCVIYPLGLPQAKSSMHLKWNSAPSMTSLAFFFFNRLYFLEQL